MINARAETVFSRSAFARPIREQRCLIPADGFIEWQTIRKAKHPVHLRLVDGELFAMAGIWQRWSSPERGEVYTCSILTTVANEVVQPVHDRMPVILHPDDYDAWLDPDLQAPERLASMLRPFPAEAMTSVSISPRINDVAHDDPACLTEVEAPPKASEQLGFHF